MWICTGIEINSMIKLCLRKKNENILLAMQIETTPIQAEKLRVLNWFKYAQVTLIRLKTFATEFSKAKIILK